MCEDFFLLSVSQSAMTLPHKFHKFSWLSAIIQHNWQISLLTIHCST